MTTGYETWRIEVPGTFASDVAYLDLETAKFPCEHQMANGEMLKSRWGIIWAGIALDGEISLMAPCQEGDALFLDAVGVVLAEGSSVVYSATREFDEMICRGRFTTARRAHAPEPFYPAVAGAEELNWKNVRGIHELVSAAGVERGEDCPSRDVPALAGFAPVGGGRKLPIDMDRVMIHLLRDVAEMILALGEPDAVCREWCVLVLTSWDFASDEIFGSEF